MKMAELIQKWIDAMCRHSVEDVVCLFHDDAVWEDATAGLKVAGKSEIGSFIFNWYSNIPDMNVKLNRAIIQDETSACVVWTFSGTAEGPLPPNIPATGNFFSVEGNTVFEARDGLFTLAEDYWDGYGIRVQLGVVPDPAKDN
ncbi:nuclear transport factor 2 family protein [Streptomyces sp. NPDC058701]|uniref:nuclear transport factor 2 family protein n=1 Tax=Streptomyces sp. NPDC058701 TaxID=3346608 RepID=UPI003656DD9A